MDAGEVPVLVRYEVEIFPEGKDGDCDVEPSTPEISVLDATVTVPMSEGAGPKVMLPGTEKGGIIYKGGGGADDVEIRTPDELSVTRPRAVPTLAGP